MQEISLYVWTTITYAEIYEASVEDMSSCHNDLLRIIRLVCILLLLLVPRPAYTAGGTDRALPPFARTPQKAQAPPSTLKATARDGYPPRSTTLPRSA